MSRIIDFHQHFLTNKEDYLKELIKSMDENNIEKCVMHACPTSKSIDFDFQIKTWRDVLKSLGMEEKMDKVFYETSNRILCQVST